MNLVVKLIIFDVICDLSTRPYACYQFLHKINLYGVDSPTKRNLAYLCFVHHIVQPKITRDMRWVGA